MKYKGVYFRFGSVFIKKVTKFFFLIETGLNQPVSVWLCYFKIKTGFFYLARFFFNLTRFFFIRNNLD